jgi:hypothetical protein
MKVIGIVGSRSRDTDADYQQLLEAFTAIYAEGDEIVSGGCPKGGDRFAERIAKEWQVPIKIYYAQWNKLGKGAGFSRNTNIADDCNVLIALVTKDRTGGTEDTVRKAEKANKSIILLSPPEFDPLSM